MIKELFDSLQSNIKQKTTNPFLGTLILVWIFHNWKYIYTFFNFNSWDLDKRISYLSGLLDGKAFIINLFTCIIISLIVLIGTYLLLNISRLIINFYENQVTPWVYKITDINSVVLKSKFVQILDERNELIKKLEIEREEKSKITAERDKFEKRIGEILADQDRNNDKMLQGRTLDDQQKTMVQNHLNRIENMGYLDAFDKLISKIGNKEWVDESELTKYLLKLDLIQVVSSDGRNRMFEFTPIGQIVKQHYIDRFV